MVSVTKIGRRGQLTLPRSIRRGLNLKEGDRVAFVQVGNEVVLQPLTGTLLDLRGSVPVSGSQDFASVRRRVLQERSRKVATGEE
jgi:AbrB family looped-hinge helix DNA binding protein